MFALHGFSLGTYVAHLGLDGTMTFAAYRARGFCQHPWHRVALTVAITLIGTLILVTLIG